MLTGLAVLAAVAATGAEVTVPDLIKAKSGVRGGVSGWVADSSVVAVDSVSVGAGSAAGGGAGGGAEEPDITDTVKVWALEVPPPGVGLNTVMLWAPATVRSVVGMVAVSWVEETKVVVRLEALKRTIEPDTKLVPLTVRVTAGSRLVAVVGEMEVVVGTGLAAVRTSVPPAPAASKYSQRDASPPK